MRKDLSKCLFHNLLNRDLENMVRNLLWRVNSIKGYSLRKNIIQFLILWASSSLLLYSSNDAYITQHIFYKLSTNLPIIINLKCSTFRFCCIVRFQNKKQQQKIGWILKEKRERFSSMLNTALLSCSLWRYSIRSLLIFREIVS